MTAFDYARPRATAARLIARYGQSATIRRTTRSGPDYDPITATADYACTLVETGREEKAIEGTRIKAGDLILYVSTAGLTIEPTESDALVIGGVVYEIVDLKPLSPAGTVVFWEARARR